MEESKISSKLMELGVPAGTRGFPCIVEATKLIAESPGAYIRGAETLYMLVGERLGIKPATVERAIRYAIGTGFIKEYPMKTRRKRPSNTEFLYGLYYTLK